MSRSTTEERVQHALSQLLERIIPVVSEEDEAANDERFDDAFQFALTTIERCVVRYTEVYESLTTSLVLAMRLSRPTLTMPPTS